MYPISEAFIVRWSEEEAGSLPGTVDTICPNCGLPMAFTLTAWNDAPDVETRVAASRCINCGNNARFFWVKEPKERTEAGGPPHSLFIHPTPAMTRRPIEGAENNKDFDVAVQRAYTSAVNMYNAREWTGTLVIVRRTLEDIAQRFVTPEVQKLHFSKQVEALRKSKDFSEPVATLADGLRRSGPLKPFFELEQQPDREIATLALDLLTYLIEYMFAVPARVAGLQERIEQVPARSSNRP